MSNSPTSATSETPLNVQTQPAAKNVPIRMVTAVRVPPRTMIAAVPNMFRAGKGAGRHYDNVEVQSVRQRIEVATTDGWMEIRNVVWVESINTPEGVIQRFQYNETMPTLFQHDVINYQYIVAGTKAPAHIAMPQSLQVQPNIPEPVAKHPPNLPFVPTPAPSTNRPGPYTPHVPVDTPRSVQTPKTFHTVSETTPKPVNPVQEEISEPVSIRLQDQIPAPAVPKVKEERKSLPVQEQDSVPAQDNEDLHLKLQKDQPKGK